MRAENRVTNRNRPVDERRFFEERNSVKMGGDPVSGGQHIARDLRLDRVDVVHQRRRRKDTPEKDDRREESNDQKNATPAHEPIVDICVLDCGLVLSLSSIASSKGTQS